MHYYLGAQDAADMGELLLSGRLPISRVVGLGGPGAVRPRHLRTRIGASLDALLEEELSPGSQRVLSGSVLSGREARGEIHGYLGRYHNQIAALSDDAPRRFLGWLEPGSRRFSHTRLFLSALLRPRDLAFSTELHGGKRALVPTGAYERVMPFEMMPNFLLRAILAGDVETAEELGVLELEEEDLALCSLVCPSKIEYGPALRDMLTRIEKEG
jgi:Na+-transporting NADH:ubiquinone oxidoreductase subunit A